MTQKNPYNDIVAKATFLQENYENLLKVFHRGVYTQTDRLIFIVHSLEQRAVTAKEIKEQIPTWDGKLYVVWEIGEKGLAAWTDPKWPIEIWLETPIEEFPTLNKNCKFVPVVTRERRWNYVCEKGESNVPNSE